jgi:T4-like virus Myoviridae tail sheath stabiliser
MASFFYDRQIRRFVNQFVRFFSEMYVEYGNDVHGNQVLYRVPCRYADTNRQVAAILKQNSDNSMNNVPMMVVYITQVKYDRNRMQQPKHVDSITVRTRATDPLTGNLTTAQGQSFSVDRLMPVPYTITMTMEMWTSNFDQKLQLWEQICSQFNPDMEIQSTDNYLDWTSLSYILLTDTNWTSRTIPVGSDDPIDVATLTFDMPIWLTTPAKLKRLGVITNVVASVYDAQGNLEQALIDQIALLGNRQYFTPTGYQIVIDNGNVTLFNRSGPVLDNTNINIPTTLGDQIAWKPVLDSFGEVKDNYSMLYLTDFRTDRLISGTIAVDPTNQYNLLFTVDPATLPVNTLTSVNAIVDPTANGPGVGLPAVAAGQRYLILQDIGNTNNTAGTGPVAWRNSDGSDLVAAANDIIQYDGNNWNISFHPISTSGQQYVTNTYTGIQYVWNVSQWQKSWQGLYQEGAWSIVI